ncbi:hypothetical protein F5B22DRAFT_480656 [Xylaria bambusicola]|uniref:uncharacterized protein n=1 Tax=Xylaria bambusicola TaxID=326684 RepID=UPI0020073430|nr:uncharacterized protein F5B22DRAFT_480656 [Xylaria bambusicola]KAI0506143.1 hypothetical protein F5B22DRAFT_480656 [Xylaria bambusicola]
MGRLTIIASLAGAIWASAAVAEEICTTEQAPNLLVNPSWEDGLSGWLYNFPGGTSSLSSAVASDGQTSLLLPSSASYSLMQQTVNNLVVGETYTASIDFQGIVNSNYAITEQCIIYFYHDALTTTNLFQSKVQPFNRAIGFSWQTFSGTYTATSNTMSLGFYASCTPYRSPVIFNAYLDNASLRGPPTTVCVTPTPSETPTPTPTPTPIDTPSDTPSPEPTPSSTPASSSIPASPSSTPASSSIPASPSSTPASSSIPASSSLPVPPIVNSSFLVATSTTVVDSGIITTGATIFNPRFISSSTAVIHAGFFPPNTIIHSSFIIPNPIIVSSSFISSNTTIIYASFISTGTAVFDSSFLIPSTTIFDSSFVIAGSVIVNSSFVSPGTSVFDSSFVFSSIALIHPGFISPGIIISTVASVINTFDFASGASV